MTKKYWIVSVRKLFYFHHCSTVKNATNQVLGTVLLKLDELSRQWFYVGFICDCGCKGTDHKTIRVASSRILSFGEFWKGLRIAEKWWLLNLKDCELEKRIGALAILYYGSSD